MNDESLGRNRLSNELNGNVHEDVDLQHSDQQQRNRNHCSTNRFSCACSHFGPYSSGYPFPFPQLNGAWLRDSEPCPSTRFECCAMQHPGHGGNLGKLENILTMDRQPCSEAFYRSSSLAPRIQSSGAIVVSQPCIQLTGGYARDDAWPGDMSQSHENI